MRSPELSNMAETALAFRGYNVTNLGRTAELFSIPAYKNILQEELDTFSQVCSDYTASNVNLASFVESEIQPALGHYAEAVAFIVAVEKAQIRILEEVHELETQKSKFTLGYSLGELSAVSHGGSFTAEDIIRVPLALADDVASLASDITLGILFSRGEIISETAVNRLCMQVSNEGNGSIGISAILSPNTLLLLGQNASIQRFRQLMKEALPERCLLRIKDDLWPPMHTPIVRQKHIPDRASNLLDAIPNGFVTPNPPVLSLVTGKMSYDNFSARNLMRKWVDHPQRLWDAVCEVLSIGVETIIHVGPEPNVIPATFHRLTDNIVAQTSGSSLGSIGMRAVSEIARRPWLASLLPSRASLLKAPQIKHIILEDWLIENAPSK